MENLLHANIMLHVAFGLLALLVGLGLLLTTGPAAQAAHRRWGRWFLGLATVVLATAVPGLAVFRFRPFLAVIVLLSVYQAYAGYRIRRAGPGWPDSLMAGAFLGGGLVFLACRPRIRLVWAPVVMYSTLGALLAVTAYDLSQPLWRQRWQRGAWRYEHIWKMLSTYAALLSAFSGTVLAAYQPYSQFLPSVLGVGVALGFMGRTNWQRRPAARGLA